MPDLLGLPEVQTLRESAFVGLIVIIGALLLVTIAFSTYAIFLRAAHHSREARWAHLTEQWREPVLSAVADPDTIPAVHDTVGDKQGLHFVRFVLEYARRVRGEEKRTLRELVRPYLGEIAERAGSRSIEVRARAIQTLGTLGLPQHADKVIAALDDPSPLVAMVAARALSREETPQYADAVLARLGRFEGWNRRFLAAMLAAIGPEVSEALRRGLADGDAQPWGRAVQADALHMQGDFLAGDVAAEVLGSTEDHELLTSALRLLADVGRTAHMPAVRAHCASPDVVIRAQALRALGTLGGADEIPRLLGAMDDPSPWAALYAARGVRDAGGREVLTEVAASDHPRALLAGQVLSEDVDQ